MDLSSCEKVRHFFNEKEQPPQKRNCFGDKKDNGYTNWPIFIDLKRKKWQKSPLNWILTKYKKVRHLLATLTKDAEEFIFDFGTEIETIIVLHVPSNW